MSASEQGTTLPGSLWTTPAAADATPLAAAKNDPTVGLEELRAAVKKASERADALVGRGLSLEDLYRRTI